MIERIFLDGTAASIGVIGGADGPTAIFVTGGPASWYVPALCIAALLVMLAIVLINRK